MKHLLFFLLHEVLSESVFNLITYHEYYPMSYINPIIERVWSIPTKDELDDAFWSDFEYIGCDGQVRDRTHFFKTFIRYEKRPLGMSGVWNSQTREVDRHHPSDKYWGNKFYFVDLEMANGRRIGVELSYGHWKGAYYMKRAFVYNCEPKPKPAVTFRNYVPVFKAQKLLNDIWNIHKTTRVDQLLGTYFAKNFEFEDCADEKHHSSTFNTLEFFEGFLRSCGRIQPLVVNSATIKTWWATCCKEEIGVQWQVEVKWGARRFQMEMEQDGDKLAFTRGREWPCHSYW